MKCYVNASKQENFHERVRNVNQITGMSDHFGNLQTNEAVA